MKYVKAAPNNHYLQDKLSTIDEVDENVDDKDEINIDEAIDQVFDVVTLEEHQEVVHKITCRIAQLLVIACDYYIPISYQSCGDT